MLLAKRARVINGGTCPRMYKYTGLNLNTELPDVRRAIRGRYRVRNLSEKLKREHSTQLQRLCLSSIMLPTFSQIVHGTFRAHPVNSISLHRLRKEVLPVPSPRVILIVIGEFTLLLQLNSRSRELNYP